MSKTTHPATTVTESTILVTMRTAELIESIDELFGTIETHELIHNLHTVLSGFMDSPIVEGMDRKDLSRITYYQTLLMAGIQNINEKFTEYRKGGQL